MNGPDTATRVFISYAQHGDRHPEEVLALVQALRHDGLAVELDQFYGQKLLNWQRWCRERLRPENARWVLMVCSTAYRDRLEGDADPHTGKGVYWEGGLIGDAIYHDKDNRRFVPVLLGDEPETAIPAMVRGWTHFRLRGFDDTDPGYEGLYRLLTDQPAIAPAPVGELRRLPSRSGARAATTSAQPHNLPYPPLGTLFKGRDAALAALRAGFVPGRGATQAIGPRHAIHGLGGIGKTRLAVEYAWRHADDYSALLFVTAAPTGAPDGATTDRPPAAALTQGHLLAQFAGLAPVLGVAAGVTDSGALAAAVLHWLAQPAHAGWLLILDNLDDEATATAADHLLANLTQGHLLLTGRLANWPAHVRPLPLDVLERDAARDFLLERTADRRRPRPDDADQAQTLAAELDGLALALEQAAAFICREGIGLADYLARWRRADARVRRWHDARVMNYPRPLATTWQTSAEVLSAPARALLDLIAWLGPEPLPRLLFDHTAAPEGLAALFADPTAPARALAALAGTDPAPDPAEALAQLADLSLLQGADPGFDSPGRLHRVTGLMIRECQPADRQTAALGAALDLAAAAAVGDPGDVRHWPVWGPLAPHLTALLAHTEGRGIGGPEARLLNDLGLFLKAQARHAQAEPLMRRALACLLRFTVATGHRHPHLDTFHRNYAGLLKASGTPPDEIAARLAGVCAAAGADPALLSATTTAGGSGFSRDAPSRMTALWRVTAAALRRVFLARRG